MEPYLVTALITLGASFAGVRGAMNGIYKRLDRIETLTDAINTSVINHGERLMRIETTLRL